MDIIFPAYSDEIRSLLEDVFDNDGLTIRAAVEGEMLYLNTLYTMDDLYDKINQLMNKYESDIKNDIYVNHAQLELVKLSKLKRLLMKG